MIPSPGTLMVCTDNFGTKLRLYVGPAQRESDCHMVFVQIRRGFRRRVTTLASGGQWVLWRYTRDELADVIGQTWEVIS